MARIAGINIPVQKHTEIGLTSIFGIGRTRAREICAAAGILPTVKIKDLTEEEVEKDYPEFSKRLKWSLIVNRIGKDQDIKVEPEEIKEHTATQLRAQMASYGLADLGDEQVEQYVMSMLQQREHVEKTRDDIMEEKLNSFFKSKVRIKDKKVTLEQFTS